MKEILLYQLKASWNHADWFVPLATAIEDVSEAQAAAKHNEQSNSIEEIVHHLIYWNELYLNRFKDAGFSFRYISNDETFQNPPGLSWQQACGKIKAVFDDWISALAACDDEKLNSVIPANGKTWAITIGNLASHTAYHTGQIVTLRKEYGFWNPEKGVN